MSNFGTTGVLVCIALLSIASLVAICYAARQYGWLYIQRPILQMIAVLGFVCILGAPIAGPICGTLALGFLALINVVEVATDRIVASQDRTTVLLEARVKKSKAYE